jgi:hypothetical protein
VKQKKKKKKVSPSSSSPGLVSGKKFCHCLIKGEKTKQTTQKKTTAKQINPKFKCNTVLVSPSASSPSSVIVSSKDEKNNKKKCLETAL